MKTEYCELCCHKVYSLTNHLSTEEHRRRLKQQRLGGLKPLSKHFVKAGAKTHYGGHVLRRRHD